MSEKPTPQTIVVKRYMVPNRLATLVNRPGGRLRDEAIAEATRNLETVRGTSMDAIEDLIGDIERQCDDCCTAPKVACEEIKRLANQIITISGTYGLSGLSEACKRLCDLISAAATRPKVLQGPLSVHVGAIRLLSPKNSPLDATSAMLLLGELRRVLEHFDVAVPKEAPVD